MLYDLFGMLMYVCRNNSRTCFYERPHSYPDHGRAETCAVNAELWLSSTKAMKVYDMHGTGFRHTSFAFLKMPARAGENGCRAKRPENDDSESSMTRSHGVGIQKLPLTSLFLRPLSTR